MMQFIMGQFDKVIFGPTAVPQVVACKKVYQTAVSSIPMAMQRAVAERNAELRVRFAGSCA